MTSPFSTVRDLLRHATSRFNRAGLYFGHGSSNAYDEAAYLILHTLGLPLDKLDPFLDARLLPEEIDELIRVLEKADNSLIEAEDDTDKQLQELKEKYRKLAEQQGVKPVS